MRRALILSVLVVALVASGFGVAAAQEPDTGDALVGNASALPTTESGETIISGLDDPSLSLIGVEYSTLSGSTEADGVVSLRIRSDSSETIQVLDAFGSGGESATILRPQTRSLSQGVNVVEIEARKIRGVAVVNVMGDGDTAQIPLDAGGRFDAPEEENPYVAAGSSIVIAGIWVFLVLSVVVWLRGKVVEIVKDANGEAADL
jgi:hypothetical protein